MHRRRNREGTGGTCPPPTNREGGQCPHSQSSVFSYGIRPSHVLMGQTMRCPRISSYKVCSDRLTVHFFIASTKRLLLSASWTQNGRGFNEKWAWPKNFRARYARNFIQCPPNLQHLPTPTEWSSPSQKLPRVMRFVTTLWFSWWGPPSLRLLHLVPKHLTVILNFLYMCVCVWACKCECESITINLRR